MTEEITVKPRKVIPYKPCPRTEKILDYCWDRLMSIPYKPSSRWLFYRAFQKFGLTKEDVKKFDNWLSNARKRYYKEWRPDTLIDSIRNIMFRGYGKYSFDLDLDKVESQDYYIQVWFEARAMSKQFEYFTKGDGITLVPFGGSVSIPIKWEIAKSLEDAKEKWDKPIVILYFGDYDTKGRGIPKEALKDIQNWCDVDFKVIWCGLTKEQAMVYKLPENPEKPSQYQWEALDHDQAGEIIRNSIENLWNRDLSLEIIGIEEKIKKDFPDWLKKKTEEYGV